MKAINIGDKIKSFQVMHIVDGFAYNYDDKGRKIKYATKYLFLLSASGEERVLEMGKTSLRDCLQLVLTFGSKHKYIKWNQF